MLGSLSQRTYIQDAVPEIEGMLLWLIVRRTTAAWSRGTGASERELEALAIYMGHSMAMQRDTYDRCGPHASMLWEL